MMKVLSSIVLGLAIHLIVGTPTYDGGKSSNKCFFLPKWNVNFDYFISFNIFTTRLVSNIFALGSYTNRQDGEGEDEEGTNDAFVIPVEIVDEYLKSHNLTERRAEELYPRQYRRSKHIKLQFGNTPDMREEMADHYPGGL